MAKVKITFKKKVVIELNISAFSHSLNETELRKAVDEDITPTIKKRLESFGGGCGCSNDGKSFGYEYEQSGITYGD